MRFEEFAQQHIEYLVFTANLKLSFRALSYQSARQGYGGDVSLKEFECVQVNHHKDVGRVIEEWQSKGWRLHTYSCAQLGGSEINHYLPFERGE